MEKFDVDLANRMEDITMTVYGVRATDSKDAIDQALTHVVKPFYWHCTGVDKSKAQN